MSRHRQRRAAAVTAAAAALLALAACGGEADGGDDGNTNGMEQAAYRACRAYVDGVAGVGMTAAERADLAESVHSAASGSGVAPIRDAADVLARTAASGADDDEWEMAADAFGVACIENGWSTTG
ncbi:hypothetical protein [Streptomyces sp. RFCAC02]|uniref:hypothetical protein n=1 Tax=Streptomyces sp. RFCAC02 TaxID=2499143 RepID=UPI001020F861|nr:hypothetical protein [Streptomyces sp. RFCAC02]